MHIFPLANGTINIMFSVSEIFNVNAINISYLENKLEIFVFAPSNYSTLAVIVLLNHI